jgi:hypothetical protein
MLIYVFEIKYFNFLLGQDLLLKSIIVEAW